MPRIRTIKPEFCESESIGRLSHGARLLFLQLFTAVDDDVRFRTSPRLLLCRLYPYDDADTIDENGVERLLRELEDQKCVRRYQVQGSQFLEIVSWSKHQKIDHK